MEFGPVDLEDVETTCPLLESQAHVLSKRSLQRSSLKALQRDAHSEEWASAANSVESQVFK